MDAPATLHLQMRVECRSGLEPVKKVLSDAHDLQGPVTHEVDGRERGPTQVSDDQNPS